MSVNKVILLGNVGKDPEVRYLDNNNVVARFPLATTERGYTGRDGRQIPDRTEWHNIVVWRGLAQVVEKYVKKGTQLFIEGKIRTNSYEKDGIKRYSTEIYVDNLTLLGRRPDGSAPTNEPSMGSATNNYMPASAPMEQSFIPPTPTPSPFDNLPEVEDDLPF
ncbi:single-strand DNA-binding protein [Breznakibacter xylanolyticus]|uniref:Single-stranded DNA-binding protein n=1 Tax=Breznakibacter xylanolyticus TaxID=990 RepID=A0A2W7NBA0_9BACT|nr:single-stranded DNA-binding protein [Breznakibacter xylanolyticus]PZX16913.1 single-strand DNA-binding protein [Breznakibacter xylanolyticus]